MPRGDATWPDGQGPKTGRSLGKCGKGTRNSSQGGQGGRGSDRSGGRGFEFYPPVGGTFSQMTVEDEINMLKDNADYMKNSLDEINKRIKELEKTVVMPIKNDGVYKVHRVKVSVRSAFVKYLFLMEVMQPLEKGF